MSTLINLIDKAASITGSDYKLAKALGVPQSRVSAWRHGRDKCTPPDRARLAGFAREDALQELVRATLEDKAGTLRGEQLQRLLGKSWRQTGGALHSVLPVTASLTYGISWLARCILLLTRTQRTA